VAGGWLSSRRRFLEALAGGGAALLLPRRSASAPPDPTAGPATAEHPGCFDEAGRAALARLADFVLPGAAQRGAVEYVERLLTAFDHDPPRIHAGGPYSGRRPFALAGRASDSYPPGDFENWVPLDRVSERAWRLRIHGSGPGDPLGPVTGLRPLLVDGAARAAAHGSTRRAWSAQTAEFRARFTELVIEACFADPVYGGNRAESGWREIDFEGDVLPLGFMPWDASAAVYRERPDAPYSRRVAEPDPAPLGWRTRLWLGFLAFLSRRGALG
jgi:hypothetical protein